jgi:hypothetical protein
VVVRLAVVLLVAGLACDHSVITAVGGDGGPGGGKDAPTLGPPRTDGGAPARADAGPTTPPGGEKCAEEAHMAEQAPVDLLLLIDRSGSMNTRAAGGRSKWQMAQEAVTAFISDPKSAGLGVGMEFFPVPSDGTCTTDVDCGFAMNVGQFCVERRACVGATGPTNASPPCGTIFDEPCPSGTMCVPLGRCSQTGVNCVGIGRACPGGAADNLCTNPGKVCVVGLSDSCKLSDYQKPAVPIGDLPAARAALAEALRTTTAGGGTPTGPAVQGALGQLRMRPQRRGVLVLVTDGVPSPCETDDPVAAVSAQLRMARMTAPSIATYIVGVFGANEGQGGPIALRDWATAGGTGMPFVLTPTDDLAQKLLEALSQIRGAALACQYAIPPARAGSMIDFKKVNLHFKGTSGEEDIGYVGRADRCDPMRGGWYYDVDPDLGTPSSVIVCDATCRRFRGDATGRVELRFGCKTRVIE